MEQIARCSTNQASEKNIRRNLHNLIHRVGKTLPISIDYVRCNVRLVRGKIEVILLPWPVIMLSSWMQFILSSGGKLLLAGFHIAQEYMWRQLFAQFWCDYKKMDPSHPVFSIPHADLSCFIPYTIHGDEGRGKNKIGVMVESFCPLISVNGLCRTNLKGRFNCNTQF